MLSFCPLFTLFTLCDSLTTWKKHRNVITRWQQGWQMDRIQMSPVQLKCWSWFLCRHGRWHGRTVTGSRPASTWTEKLRSVWQSFRSDATRPWSCSRELNSLPCQQSRPNLHITQWFSSEETGLSRVIFCRRGRVTCLALSLNFEVWQ